MLSTQSYFIDVPVGLRTVL